MNAKIINNLHSDVTESRDEADFILALLVEHEEKLSELSSRFSGAQSIWEQRVVAVGNALTDAKTQNGKGWKRDFDTLGYAFSFTTASRYIACARHPQLCDENPTVEDWAQSSAECDRAAIPEKAAQEENRKERAAIRSFKSQPLRSAEKLSPTAQRDAVNNPGDDADDEAVDRSDLQLAFKSLDEAIRNTKRYQGLLEHWDVLVAGLRQRLLPRPRVVSLVDSNDTVEMGGSQQVA